MVCWSQRISYTAFIFALSNTFYASHSYQFGSSPRSFLHPFPGPQIQEHLIHQVEFLWLLCNPDFNFILKSCQRHREPTPQGSQIPQSSAAQHYMAANLSKERDSINTIRGLTFQTRFHAWTLSWCTVLFWSSKAKHQVSHWCLGSKLWSNGWQVGWAQQDQYSCQEWQNFPPSSTTCRVSNTPFNWHPKWLFQNRYKE